jgi:hypothetical protein
VRAARPLFADGGFHVQQAGRFPRRSCMSLFSEPTVDVDPPSRSALVIPLLIGAAIFLADTLIQWPDSATERAPVGLIGGGAIALGGVVGWLWRRSRARAS